MRKKTCLSSLLTDGVRDWKKQRRHAASPLTFIVMNSIFLIRLIEDVLDLKVIRKKSRSLVRQILSRKCRKSSRDILFAGRLFSVRQGWERTSRQFLNHNGALESQYPADNDMRQRVAVQSI